MVRLERYGPPEVLALGRGPRPSCGPGEVLVRVVAAGVNRIDAKTRAGLGVAALNELPMILGWDLAGTVVGVGEGVDDLRAGDRVYGMPRFPVEAGCYAGYAVAPADEIAAAPERVDLATAAAVPLCGLTALQALTEHARVGPGQTVLVHAGAGGVGHLAVQLAKILGARVVTTASAANAAFLADLGADEVIDYAREPFEQRPEGVDVVVDAVGGAVGRRSLDALRPGGRLVALTDDPDGDAARARGVHAERMRVRPDRAGLVRLAELVDADRLRVTVAARLPLARAGEAHELSEAGHVRGKVVLETGES